MSLLEIKVDLNRVATALESIATCLDKLCPPIYPQKNAPKSKQEYPIEIANNETTYLHEVAEQLEWYKDKVELLMREFGDKIIAHEEETSKD